MKMGMWLSLPSLSNLPGSSRPGGGGTPVPPEPPFSNTKSLLLNGTSGRGSTTTSGWGASFTWSAWVKLASSSSFSGIYFAADGITGATPFFIFNENAGTTNLYYGGACQSCSLFSNTAIDTGSWNHVLLIKSSGALSFFINGEKDSATGTDATNYPDGNAFIGNLPPTYGDRFGVDGNIDELALFDYALSDPEIDSIWNNGTPGDVSSLNPVNWWRFENNVDDSGEGSDYVTLSETGATYSTSTP